MTTSLCDTTLLAQVGQGSKCCERFAIECTIRLVGDNKVSRTLTERPGLRDENRLFGAYDLWSGGRDNPVLPKLPRSPNLEP